MLVAGQPNGAASWFPCNDHPRDKASYLITVTTDANYRAVCNGVLLSRTSRASRETWVYEQAEPMATYLATVQIGRYELLTLNAERPSGHVPQYARRSRVAGGRRPDRAGPPARHDADFHQLLWAVSVPGVHRGGRPGTCWRSRWKRRHCPSWAPITCGRTGTRNG